MTMISKLLNPLQANAQQSKPVVRPRNRVTSTEQMVTTNIAEEIILRRGGLFIVNDGFDKTASLSVAAGAGETTLISVTVPEGGDQALLVTHYANYLNDIAGWGYYTWNLYVNGVPVEAYYGVLDQMGQTNLMRRVGVDILITGGQTLLATVTPAGVIPGGPFSPGISLIGAYGTYNYNRG